ncbi:hypothetical protein FRX31_032445 [Thalictrum thalictroides]|uniref:Uncharacterized protein n=1 Tax=Thalictrum thalictroides TaxID=46969 RepID=A0A7J6UZU1_THATH|nr:hypothetical protein FRX31_032445 [Thalictrum thalictroides]
MSRSKKVRERGVYGVEEAAMEMSRSKKVRERGVTYGVEEAAMEGEKEELLMESKRQPWRERKEFLLEFQFHSVTESNCNSNCNNTC